MERPPKSKRKPEPTPAARALRLLARRDHTRVELRRKLARYVPEPAELDALLDDFTARGWLSEARAIEQIVRTGRSRFGAARIRQSLVDKGAAPDLIAPALAALKETELDAARSLWARRFQDSPQTPADCARQVRFLQSRGFSLDVAMRVVRRR